VLNPNQALLHDNQQRVDEDNNDLLYFIYINIKTFLTSSDIVVDYVKNLNKFSKKFWIFRKEFVLQKKQIADLITLVMSRCFDHWNLWLKKLSRYLWRKILKSRTKIWPLWTSGFPKCLFGFIYKDLFVWLKSCFNALYIVHIKVENQGNILYLWSLIYGNKTSLPYSFFPDH